MSANLLVLHEGKPAHVIRLRPRPLQVGRAPNNDLAIVEPTISRCHASLWRKDSTTWLVDHSSTHGTRVNGRPVAGVTALADGDLIEIGTGTYLKHKTHGEPPPAPPYLILHDQELGVLRRLHAGMNELDGQNQLIVAHDGSSLSLVSKGKRRPVSLDKVFEADGRSWCVSPHFEHAESLLEDGPSTESAFMYAIASSLNGRSGAEAHVRQLPNGEPVLIGATPAVLLYLLVRQRASDLERGVPGKIAGWCNDNDLRQGIWGRNGPKSSNSLNVLLYRTRRELERSGFNGMCLEKKRGATRICVMRCELR
jgi:hypothetical protein